MPSVLNRKTKGIFDVEELMLPGGSFEGDSVHVVASVVSSQYLYSLSPNS